MADRLKMIVPGKPEYVGTVRIAAAHMASQAGFNIEAIDDIKVAISEACTNIVIHSHKNNDSAFEYDVALELDETKLTITVQDAGAGFELKGYIEPIPGDICESGLGIFIIRALMDEVDIASEPGRGTYIKMTKYL